MARLGGARDAQAVMVTIKPKPNGAASNVQGPGQSKPRQRACGSHAYRRQAGGGEKRSSPGAVRWLILALELLCCAAATIWEAWSFKGSHQEPKYASC